MEALPAVNFVATTVVGLGSSRIIRTIIANNVQPQNIVDNVTITSASLVLGAMVADVSKRYTSVKIHRAAIWLRKMQEQQKTTEQT